LMERHQPAWWLSAAGPDRAATGGIRSVWVGEESLCGEWGLAGVGWKHGGDGCHGGFVAVGADFLRSGVERERRTPKRSREASGKVGEGIHGGAARLDVQRGRCGS
jgi:hypothetical protein